MASLRLCVALASAAATTALRTGSFCCRAQQGLNQTDCGSCASKDFGTSQQGCQGDGATWCPAKRQAGERCHSYSQCAPGLECAGQPDLARCEPRRQAGQRCGVSLAGRDRGQCAHGLECVGDPMLPDPDIVTCEPRQLLGQLCGRQGGRDFGECGQGLECGGGAELPGPRRCVTAPTQPPPVQV